MQFGKDQEVIQENDPRLTYSEHWTRSFDQMYYGGSIQRTTRQNEWVELKFNGSGIAFIGAEGWDHSAFRVLLDGRLTTIDASCCFNDHGGVPQAMQFVSEGLDHREHNIRIVNISPGPGGGILEVDAFIVRKHPCHNPALGFGVPRPTATLLALISLIVFLNLLFLHVRKWNNIQVKERETELGLPLINPELSRDEEIDSGRYDERSPETSRLLGSVAGEEEDDRRARRASRERDVHSVMFFRPLPDPPPSYATVINLVDGDRVTPKDPS